MHKLNWRSWPLAVKLIVAMTAMVVLAAAIITLLSISREQQTFQAELEDKARLLVQTLSVSVADPLIKLDAAGMRNLMSGLGQDQAVLLGRIYDQSGRIVADAHDPQAGFRLQADPMGQKLLESDTIVFEWSPEQLTAGQSVNVGSQRLGAVSVGLSTTPLMTKLNAIGVQGFVAALITALAGAALAVVLGRSITRPLQNLVTVTKRVAAGDLSQQIASSSGDELGTLASSFNDMTAQLRQTLGNLQNRTRDLTLAAEVSHSMARVRNLDALLADAVELIRARFDLYHTQVYLTDAAGHHLTLRASTGSAGLELLRRGHRLPINFASINGTVAAEKRAVIVADTASSSTFKPNPLLPDTRSEMAVPLMVGDRVVGVLDLQSTQPGTLTAENLPAFETLAGQMAIAIENAALFAEAEQARAEVEAQAQRLSRSGWHEFLDAVNRSERLGYSFDQQTLMPLIEPLPAANDPDTLDTPILVAGAPIGRIQLERDIEADQSWASADLELVNSVASRVATQIENLRLLAQAEQYRVEAETAMRRLTREGWDALRTRGELAPGYVYDLNEVKPLSEKSNAASAGVVKRSFVVRDEPIGELAIDVQENFEEAAEIIAAVAERLSGHIENLRLSFQMQQALATTQKQAQREEALRQITSAVRGSTDPATIMRTAVRELGSILGRKTVIRMATAEQVGAATHDGNTSDSPAGSSPSARSEVRNEHNE